jgi:hypothetical protein
MGIHMTVVFGFNNVRGFGIAVEAKEKVPNAK